MTHRGGAVVSTKQNKTNVSAGASIQKEHLERNNHYQTSDNFLKKAALNKFRSQNQSVLDSKTLKEQKSQKRKSTFINLQITDDGDIIRPSTME